MLIHLIVYLVIVYNFVLIRFIINTQWCKFVSTGLIEYAKHCNEIL